MHPFFIHHKPLRAFAIHRADGVRQAKRQTVGVSKALPLYTVHPVHKKRPLSGGRFPVFLVRR